jgi:hypothetical protein
MANYFGDFLPGTDLLQGDFLFSATGAFVLAMQLDGNLVLYVMDDTGLPNPGGNQVIRNLPQSLFPLAPTPNPIYHTPIWASGTNNGDPQSRCRVTSGGELLVVNLNNDTHFDNFAGRGPVPGVSGGFLRCQDDGNLVVYVQSGALWASNTNVNPGSTSGGGTLFIQP